MPLPTEVKAICVCGCRKNKVMIIVPLTKAHIDDIVLLEKICFSTPWSEQALSAELNNPNAYFLTATVDGIVAGYLGLYDIVGECYITNIAVFPEFRRSGIARALLSKAESKAKARGSTFLTLEVRQSNAAAIALYSSSGYVSVGIRRDFYSNPTENACLMTKNL